MFSLGVWRWVAVGSVSVVSIWVGVLCCVGVFVALVW